MVALTTLYTTICLWGARLDVFNKLYTIDDYGTFFKVIFLIVLSLITILSIKYGEREEIASGEYYSLLMFGVLGMMVMVSSHSFITIFIGLEVMSLSIYILCGLMRKNAELCGGFPQVLPPRRLCHSLSPLWHGSDLRRHRADRRG